MVHILSTTSKYKKIPNNIFNVVIEERQSAILVFGAEWSGNTSIMDSMMERISQEVNSGIQFFKVDIEKQEEISSFFGISTVPTTVMLKDGEVAELIKGFLPAKRMRDKILSVYLEK